MVFSDKSYFFYSIITLSDGNFNSNLVILARADLYIIIEL